MEKERERVVDRLPPARADPVQVNITGLVTSFTMQAHLLPPLGIFVCCVGVGTTLVTRDHGEVGTLPHQPSGRPPFQLPLPGSRAARGDF